MTLSEAFQFIQETFHLETDFTKSDQKLEIMVDDQYTLLISKNQHHQLNLTIELHDLQSHPLSSEDWIELLKISGALFPDNSSCLILKSENQKLILYIDILLENNDKEGLHKQLTSFLNDAELYTEYLKNKTNTHSFSPYSPFTYFTP